MLPTLLNSNGTHPSDFHLATNSPCINAGTDSFVSSGDTDLDGNPRIYGSHVDMGTYEWIPSPYPDIASLTISPTTVSAGQSVTAKVTLTGKALAPGAVIDLSVSDPSAASIPFTVTVPTGSKTITFKVTGKSLSAPETVTVQATYRGITQSATVTVVPLLGSVTVSPAAVKGGASAIGTITLNAPAPAGGITVVLSSNDTAVSLPPSIGISAGKSKATFTVKTSSVTTRQTATITASYGGASVLTTLSIDPAGTLSSLSVTPSPVTGGLSAIGVVTLISAAPTGGLSVALTSSSPGTASVPSAVVVPVGKKSAQFVVSTSAVSASTTVTLSASAGGVTQTFKLSVVPVTIASLTLVPSSVTAGDNSIGIVQLTAAAPVAVTVTLSSANPSVALPDVKSIVIPAGAYQGTFNISTKAGSVTASTVVSITATAYKASTSANLTVSP